VVTAVPVHSVKICGGE